MNYIFHQPIPREEFEAELRDFARMALDHGVGVITRMIISFETTFPPGSWYAPGPDQVHTMHIEGRLTDMRRRRRKSRSPNADSEAKR